MPGGGRDDTPNPNPQTVQPLDIGNVRAPAANANNNELIRDVKRDEARATQAGLNPDALFQSFGKIVSRPVFEGTGREKKQTGTREEFHISKKSRAKFEKAQADFAARGGSNASAEGVSRGSGGGSFQTVGDFGGGGISIGGVKPLGG